MPGHDPAAETAEPGELTVLPVHVGHDVNVQGQAADFGAWSTVTTPAGADQARPVLPFDKQRHRAVLIVSGAAGGVWVGTQSQCQAAPPVGGFLTAGAPGMAVIIENNQALWLIGDGAHSCTVTVLQERWDSAQA
jgi:hypothetical protein